MSYDFTEANDFLIHEIEATPEQFLEEIRGAICKVQDIEYAHGESEASQDIFSVLLICADFIERITPSTAKQAV